MVTYKDDHILYLCRKDIELACKEIDSVAIIREVFRMHGSNQTVLPDEAYLAWMNEKGEDVRSLSMPGYLGGSLHIAGTKIINSNIRNPERGLPRASGMTLLYDDISARLICIMEGAYLSSLRTASVTALATDLLKGENFETAAIIGAGVLAQAHADLLVRRFPQLRQLQIFDVDKRRATAFHNNLAPVLEAHHVALKEAATAEEAIRSAQLVIPVTTTTVGYIRFGWLQPGSLLVNISLDDPMPEVVLKADKVIVDDWNLVRNDSRRLIGRMYREGKIIGPDDLVEDVNDGRRRIDAQLGEIVVGARGGRRSAHEVILVNPFGLAIEDVALAAHVYQTARTLGIGRWLER